jgi:hypothetical protein
MIGSYPQMGMPPKNEPDEPGVVVAKHGMDDSPGIALSGDNVLPKPDIFDRPLAAIAHPDSHTYRKA